MEVITTTSGLRNYGSSYPYSIAYVGMQRKDSIDSFHQGHIECLNMAKAHADKVLVGFTSDEEILNHLFSEWKLNYKTPDKDACLQWALNNEVDLVFWPDQYEMLAWFDGYDVNELRNWAINYSKDNGFVVRDGGMEMMLHSMMIVDKVRYELGLERRDYRIGSWKDGIIRFYHKYFIERSNYYNYVLTPCIIDTSIFVPYANSELLEKLSSAKVLFSKIPSIINNNKGYIYSDVEIFKQNIITQINSLDSNGVFHVLNVDVYYNKPFIDERYAFIELYLYVNDTFSTGYPGVEGQCLYPFYIAL